MVDTTQYGEGQYLTADMVKSSPSKKLVIVGEPKGKPSDFGERLTADVEMDGKKKEWRLNRDTVKNMQTLGIDSKYWNGAEVNLQVVTISGKESIIGVPAPKPQQ